MKIGSLSFRSIAIVKDQLGSLCDGLLQFIPINGYDVCGDRMLGSRCVCSGASAFIVLYIWFVTNAPQNDLMRPLALLVEMEDLKNVVLLSA